MTYFVLGISILFILVGFIGIIIPALPDWILIFLGVLIYAVFTNFEKVSWSLLLIIAGLSGLMFLMEYLSAILGAKKFGASGYGMVGAVLGGIVGLVILNIFGAVIGAVLGAVVFEIIFDRKELEKAIKSGVGVLFGLIFGVFFKIILAIIIVGLFLSAVV